MPKIFDSVQVKAPVSSTFDLGHDVKLSFNMGELIPVLAMEIAPGDRVGINAKCLLRFAPLTSPMMHRCNVFFHTFFVPFRILWPNWEKYATNGGATPVTEPPAPLPAFPTILVGEDSYGRLDDYLGFPLPDQTTLGNAPAYSAMYHAAYQCIYDQWFRDQNMQDPIPYELADGNNSRIGTGWTVLRNRAWEHDYFTSCLPFAQKGQPVPIPFGGAIPVKLNNITPGDSVLDGTPQDATVPMENTDDPGIAANNLYTQMDATNAPDINELRMAFRLQEYLEKNARGGTRYIEWILAHFNVRSSDARMQRPEFIQGVINAVQISEVLQNSATEDPEGTALTPQGNMAGHGIAAVKGKYGKMREAEEHGVLMTLMSVLPKTAYQQGVPRQFLKTTSPLDFLTPEFAQIGEQAVYNDEIYGYQMGAARLGTFGYIPRYSEYKYMPSRVCGDMRTTLDNWHMARYFEGAPSLNEDFIISDPTHRPFAVTDPDVQKMIAHVLFDIKANRRLPFYGTPTF